MTPLTPAGQALCDFLTGIEELSDWERVHIYNDLCGAERQAADRALAELRREVEGQWTEHEALFGARNVEDCDLCAHFAVVLALIDKASKPEEGA